MASRLEKITACDVCGKEPATEYVVTINGDSFEIDLDGDDDKWITGLMSQLIASGRIVKGSRKRNGGLTIVPDHERRGPGGATKSSGLTKGELKASANAEPVEWRTCVFGDGLVSKNRSALNVHYGQRHGTSITKVDKEQGRVFACPTCGEPFETYVKWSAHADREGHRPRPLEATG